MYLGEASVPTKAAREVFPFIPPRETSTTMYEGSGDMTTSKQVPVYVFDVAGMGLEKYGFAPNSMRYAGSVPTGAGGGLDWTGTPSNRILATRKTSGKGNFLTDSFEVQPDGRTMVHVGTVPGNTGNWTKGVIQGILFVGAAVVGGMALSSAGIGAGAAAGTGTAAGAGGAAGAAAGAGGTGAAVSAGGAAASGGGILAAVQSAAPAIAKAVVPAVAKAAIDKRSTHQAIVAAEEQARAMETQNVAPAVSPYTNTTSIAPRATDMATALSPYTSATLAPEGRSQALPMPRASTSTSWLLPLLLGGGVILATLIFTGRRAKR